MDGIESYAPAFGRQGHGHVIFQVISLLFRWPERAPSRQSGISGVKGHNMNEISFPGSPALWAGSFTFPYKFNRF